MIKPVRLLGVALLLILTTLVVTPAASAHTALVSSDPAADATLATGPVRVSATFSEDVLTTYAAMTVVGPDGNLWSLGDPEIKGAVVSVGVRQLGPAGKYTVNYRVTADDGHVVSGSWSFSVTAPSTGTPGPAVTDTGRDEQIPLWPFAAAAVVVVAAAAVWRLRRRS